ncbi:MULTISPECIES: PAS domain S-box protein [Halorussus]|uniref:PAS domain S-box protein n=1 Tax=Halorussus TaxID=1070314 RepID=UPI000E212E05|nr:MULTISPECIES: PAS domain S-box protein [Halorussus]NHN61500.1 PAS domain S-box protein [Halorussus sp. JP-T4]
MSEELREEKRKIEELHEVASEMAGCHDEAEVYRLGVDAAEEILEFDICGIDVEEDGYLVPVATSTEMPTEGYESLEADAGIAGRTYQSGESFVVDDVRRMDVAEPVQQEYRSILSVPVGDRGVFQAGSRETDAFDEDDRELAELLLSHVSAVVSRIDSQTALRESEEKYRTLVEGSHDAIFIHDDERFRFVNDRVSELTGYDRDELVGMPVWDVVHEDDVDRVRQLIERRKADRQTPHYQLRIRSREGEVRYLELSVQAITYDGQRAHLGSARDVTERRKRKRKLERKNERLKEFTSVVSHDLRNPLNVAQGHLELARGTGADRHFEKTESALSRMESLIDDLLALARQGQDVSDTESVALDAVVRRAWSSVSTGDASLAVADDLPAVEADAGRLQELLENLFRNAVEHGSTSPHSQAREDAVEHGSASPRSQARGDAVEHGGDAATVRVGPLTASAPDAGDAEIAPSGFYVEDDGQGIPPDEREKVFEHGHTTADDGSGLGLAIVSSIAEAHGWEVGVTDGEAGGARFEVRTT